MDVREIIYIEYVYDFSEEKCTKNEKNYSGWMIRKQQHSKDLSKSVSSHLWKVL